MKVLHVYSQIFLKSASTYLVKQSAYKELRFFRDYAREKWPLKGSKDADNLYRFQVSGFGCQEGESQNPET